MISYHSLEKMRLNEGLCSAVSGQSMPNVKLEINKLLGLCTAPVIQINLILNLIITYPGQKWSAKDVYKDTIGLNP